MNWTGKMAKLFVENGKLSLLLMMTLFLWGILSFFQTPKQYNPKITAPAFQIKVEFPGASRSEVLEQVTKPLENVIANIPNVEDIYSITRRGGFALLTVNFYVGEDPDSAKISISDKIQSNLNLAPLGISPPSIRSIDPEDVPVITIALTSDSYTQVKLRKFAFKLRDRLTSVSGASIIEVEGGRRRELSILIDPHKIAKNLVSIVQIEAALRRSNIFLPSGVIKTDGEYIPLESTSVVIKPDDLKNLIVVTGDFGQIRLKDIAKVKEQSQEIEDHVRHVKKSDSGIVRKKSAVLMSIAKHAGTNISDITDSVKLEMEVLKKAFIPASVNAEIIINEGDVASEEIGALVSNLILAILIVVVLLLVFLDTRAAMLVAVAIPLTLASVFGIAWLSGQNINRITLFALILSLGLLVDNATVVIENIVRQLSLSKKGNKTNIIISSVNEVGPALVMSTVTTVIAFLPMSFVTGMMGPYMGPIPFFVPAALILSLLISFSINPWFASVVLTRPKSKLNINFGEKINTLVAWIKDKGAIIFDAYEAFLDSLLKSKRKRRFLLIAVAGLLFLSLLLPAVKLVKFRMLPKADRKQFFLYVDLPAGTPLHETYRVSAELEKHLLNEKEIVMLQSYIARPPIMDFNGLFRGVGLRGNTFQATIRVGLTDPDSREITSEKIVHDLRPKILGIIPKISADKKIKLKFVEDPPGPPVLSTMLVRIQGYDESLVNDITADLHPSLNKIEDLVDTDTSLEDETVTIQVKIDHFQASRSRLEPYRIVKTLNTLYSGKVVGIYHNKENIEQEHISLRLDKKYRKNKSGLRNIHMYNDLGISIPLLNIVKLREIKTDKSILRENRITTSYVYGDMTESSVTYAAIDLLLFLKDYKLPNGKGKLENMSLFGAEYSTEDGKKVSIKIGGEWELTLEVFRDLGIAMGIAVFLIYFVLVGKFSSFKEPIIIMSTIPLSIIGVMPGFMLLGAINNLHFNATSMIGVIALAGIAVNNSIILLEFLKNSKECGHDIEKALIDAGKTRFRPIILTTITTMLGSLTIAGDPVWAGLAYSIVFGLGISSLLTLIVFPVLYFNICGKDWEK